MLSLIFVTATTTFKMYYSSHTWPTQFEHRLTCQIVWLPQRFRWVVALQQTALQLMVLKVVRASHKEVVRTGGGEDEDKTGASSKKRPSSLDIESIFNTNGMIVKHFRAEKTRKSMAFWRNLSRRLCCRGRSDGECAWI